MKVKRSLCLDVPPQRDQSSPPSSAPRLRERLAAALSVALLSSCVSGPPTVAPGPDAGTARALIDRLLPGNVTDRAGWVGDLYSGFAALSIEPSRERICAVVAVIEQESNFSIDPPVPGLGATALREIDERADRAGVPKLIVHAALDLRSSSGPSYEQRIRSARTEKDLSDIFEDFIGRVPLGRTLFESRNPVRTRGPMQVNIAFASSYAAEHPYPYPMSSSLDDELFTRRGSVYFGMAHLLGYRAPYDRYLYRFADFNAGQYSSRNAAFQTALGGIAGMRVVPDGALVPHDGNAGAPGNTEIAVRKIDNRLHLGADAIHAELEYGRSQEFERTDLYTGVFALAERTKGGPLPKAVVPRIVLRGPKITHALTTDWYARRVDWRFGRCLKR